MKNSKSVSPDVRKLLKVIFKNAKKSFPEIQAIYSVGAERNVDEIGLAILLPKESNASLTPPYLKEVLGYSPSFVDLRDVKEFSMPLLEYLVKKETPYRYYIEEGEEDLIALRKRIQHEINKRRLRIRVKTKREIASGFTEETDNEILKNIAIRRNESLKNMEKELKVAELTSY